MEGLIAVLNRRSGFIRDGDQKPVPNHRGRSPLLQERCSVSVAASAPSNESGAGCYHVTIMESV